MHHQVVILKIGVKKYNFICRVTAYHHCNGDFESHLADRLELKSCSLVYTLSDKMSDKCPTILIG